jgi:hypothetical protein
VELPEFDGWEDDDNDQPVPVRPGRERGSAMCESCCETEGTWELGPTGSRPAVLCDGCARRQLGAHPHPLDAMRAYLRRLPWVERARIAMSIGDEMRAEALEIRAEALREGHRAGQPWSAIGRATGISGARAANVASGRDRRRRDAERRGRMFTGVPR